MINPTININGTSADDLIQPRMDAYDALRDVIKTLGKVAPHGRDYPGDADRYTADWQAHYDRLNALHLIATEIMAEAVAIKNQR